MVRFGFAVCLFFVVVRVCLCMFHYERLVLDGMFLANFIICVVLR